MAASGRMSSSGPEFVVCVVGLSRTQGENFIEQQGIGKSCLCCRFVHPDFDDYTDQHQSLLALHEFTNPVINNVHFLYWGSIDRSLPTKTAEKTVPVRFHIIEQTVFYQDETSQPFSSGAQPDSIDQYAKRITGSIECPGKVSYKSRNDIEIQSGPKQQYPARLSRVQRGFMVVVDVSLKGDDFTKQLRRVEKILEHLMKQKQKYIIVVTKRDECDVESLEQAHKLKRKYRTQLIETSASKNINVRDSFRLIAWKALHKKAQGLSDSVPDYEDPYILTDKPKADHTKRHSFPTFSTLRISDSGKHRYSLVDNEEELTASIETNAVTDDRDICDIDEKISSQSERASEPDIGQGMVVEEKYKSSEQGPDLPDLVQNSLDSIE